MPKDSPLWLDVKRSLVVILGFAPGLAAVIIGFTLGFIVQMFMWGFWCGSKVLDVFDDPSEKPQGPVGIGKYVE